MEKRILGKTGYSASVITLGGFGVGYISQEVANKAIEMAMKFGVNMIDVAPSYNDAELRLAPFVKKYRDRFFIAEKTTKRTKEEAWKELNDSLKRLGTKYFDLYQFHAVSTMDELKRIFSKGGAMEAFTEAKETGLIKHIGLTGHADIQVHIKALEYFDFDTFLAPIFIGSMIKPEPVNDFRPLLKIAKEKNIGIIAIKAVCKRRWKMEERSYNIWYEPIDNQEEIDKAVWFTLSQEGVTTFSLAGDIKLWPKILDAAERYKKLDEDQIKEIIQDGKKLGYEPLFPE